MDKYCRHNKLDFLDLRYLQFISSSFKKKTIAFPPAKANNSTHYTLQPNPPLSLIHQLQPNDLPIGRTTSSAHWNFNSECTFNKPRRAVMLLLLRLPHCHQPPPLSIIYMLIINCNHMPSPPPSSELLLGETNPIIQYGAIPST